MKKPAIIATVILLPSIVLCTSGQCQDRYSDVKNKFAATNKMPVGDISDTPIVGLYQLEVGSNIIYYYPEKDLLVFGEIWKGRESLTAQKRSQLISKKVKEIPLSKAMKVGNGANTVIEFTDPDCPYCRQAAEFLNERNDVTRYVFFFPLQGHPDAKSKIRYILCSSDRGKAYKEVMAGKIDGQKVDTCPDDEVSALMKDHLEIANKAGINGTPVFWINGAFVHGANIPALEALLNQNKSKEKVP
jgi:thiol:disulfide interchange protein DsbC